MLFIHYYESVESAPLMASSIQRAAAYPVYTPINNDYSKLNIGDHIVQPGAFGVADLLHHALYMGNHKIVHYYGDPYIQQSLFGKDRSSIRIDDIRILENADNGKKLELYVQAHVNPSYTGDEVIKRAMNRLTESNYNLLNNNCEHFVIGRCMTSLILTNLLCYVCSFSFNTTTGIHRNI